MPQQEQGNSLDVVLVVSQLPDCFTRHHTFGSRMRSFLASRGFSLIVALSSWFPSTALMSDIAPAATDTPVASLQLLQHCSLTPLLPLPAGGKASERHGSGGAHHQPESPTQH